MWLKITYKRKNVEFGLHPRNIFRAFISDFLHANYVNVGKEKTDILRLNSG